MQNDKCLIGRHLKIILFSFKMDIVTY